MPKFGALGSKSLKMKLKFEIDLFKMGTGCTFSKGNVRFEIFAMANVLETIQEKLC